MNDQDLINLQKLAQRSPQLSFIPDERPDHLLAADALAAFGPPLPQLDPEELARRRMIGDALLNHGQDTQQDPSGPTYWPSAHGASYQTASYQPTRDQFGASSVNARAPQQQFLSDNIPGSGGGSAGPSRSPPDTGPQYALSSPVNADFPWQAMADQYTPPAPKPSPPQQPQPAAPTSGLQTTIDPIPGYDETGDNAWRASNDKIFLDAVNNYNAANGYRPGDPGYWTADMLKAQAMVESGGDQRAFMTDPLQINSNVRDWDDKKGTLLGLTKGQVMTPAISADAALGWLHYKGWMTDKAGQRGYIGDEGALWRYNGKKVPRSKYTGNSWDAGLNQQDWYADTIPRLARGAADARSGRRADDDFDLTP